MTDLAAYVRNAAEHPLLTATEERRLGSLIQAGRSAQERLAAGVGAPGDERMAREGHRARATLVESNLRLVIRIARRYSPHTRVDRADLIQAGNHGLITAAEKYRPDRGFRFSTYASTWIRSRITRAIDKGTSAMHLPIDVVNELRRAQRSAADGGPALDPHLLDLERAYNVISLDAPLVDSGSLADLVPAREMSVEAEAALRIESECLHRLMRNLPELHREALHARFGFVDGVPRSNRAVARALNVSERKARRLTHEGLTLLQMDGALGDDRARRSSRPVHEEVRTHA